MARRKLHRGIRYPRLQHDKITVRYDVPRRREHTGRPQRIVHHSDRSDGKGYPFVLFAITAPLPGGRRSVASHRLKSCTAVSAVLPSPNVPPLSHRLPSVRPESTSAEQRPRRRDVSGMPAERATPRKNMAHLLHH